MGEHRGATPAQTVDRFPVIALCWEDGADVVHGELLRANRLGPFRRRALEHRSANGEPAGFR